MSSTPPGKFIVIEGMDGCGKTYSTEVFCSALKQMGQPLVQTYEVGGTPIGKELRGLAFRKRDEEPLDPVARMLMIYASRIQHLRQVVWPGVQAGKFVVSDRYWMSTRVYQGIIENNEALIDSLDAQPGLELCASEPDILIYLNVLPEVAHDRGRKREGVDNDVYKRDLEHAKNVKFAYDEVILRLNKSQHCKVFEVNANLQKEQVAQQLVHIAYQCIQLHQQPKSPYHKPAGFQKP